MAYQNYLAWQVQSLGYQIEPRGYGQFDIQGYGEENLLKFSQRRKQIIALVGINATEEQRNEAWLKTRKHKTKISISNLKNKWLEQASSFGIKFVKPKSPILSEAPSLSEQSLNDAINQVSKRSLIFSQEDVESLLLARGIPLDINQIEPLMLEHTQLIMVEQYPQKSFTTEAALKRELTTILLMEAGKGKFSALMSESLLKDSLQDSSLTEAGKKAIAFSLTTTDQFIAWQGGKQTESMIQQFCLIAQNKGYQTIIVPSFSHSDILDPSIGIKTRSVADLLKTSSSVGARQLWMVTDAPSLSSSETWELLQKAKATQNRVILANSKPLKALEEGNPYLSLVEAGMSVAHINQARSNRPPQLELAVDLISQGKFEKGFTRLANIGCLVEVSADSITTRVCEDYLAMDDSTREKTVIVVRSNSEKSKLIHQLRLALKQESSLGESITVIQLIPKQLTSGEMKNAAHYAIGDVIIPATNYSRRQLEKGKFYQVVGKAENRVIIQSELGVNLLVDLSFEKTVYRQSKIDIAKGDRLFWTKDARKNRRPYGLEFKVIGIKSNLATIKYFDGDTEQLDSNELLPIDYATVTTSIKRRQNLENILFVAESNIELPEFYLALSKVKHSLKIYTPNQINLIEKAQKTKNNHLENWRVTSRDSYASTLDLTKKDYRLIYQQLANKVRQQTTCENIPQIDVRVAILVLKTSDDVNEVGRVLSQSDQIIEWKELLSEADYKTKARKYILSTYSQAIQVAEERNSVQSSQSFQSLPTNLNLEY